MQEIQNNVFERLIGASIFQNNILFEGSKLWYSEEKDCCRFYISVYS